MNEKRLLIDKYWHVVEATLIQFFDTSPSEAYRLATSYRMKVEKRFGVDEMPIIYNQEEYDLACQLAKVSDSSWEKHREEYLKLKFSYGEVLGELLELSESA
jgi:hypothetical protein